MHNYVMFKLSLDAAEPAPVTPLLCPLA